MGYAKGTRDVEGIVYKVASVHDERTWSVGGFDELCTSQCVSYKVLEAFTLQLTRVIN